MPPARWPYDLALPLQFAVELQITDVASGLSCRILLAVNMVEDLGVGEVGVEGEVARESSARRPSQSAGTTEDVWSRTALQGLTEFFLAKAAELQRIVLAAGADVVDEQVVMGDLIPLFGVIPEPADIRDQHPVMVDQRIVDGDNALVAVPGDGILLQSSRRRSLRTRTSQSAAVRKRLRQD